MKFVEELKKNLSNFKEELINETIDIITLNNINNFEKDNLEIYFKNDLIITCLMKIKTIRDEERWFTLKEIHFNKVFKEFQINNELIGLIR
jgi:hypothetical protein